MTNRREFLQIGLTASTWPLASRAARAAAVAPAAQPRAVPIYKVIYDSRFDASVAFARRAAALGAATHAIEGDMTRFWYEDLYHRWQQEPAAIAGLTAHGPLFCFEQLARDQRMRVVFRVEHGPAAGCVAHSLTGPVEMLHDPAAALATSGEQWAERMAELVTRCPSGRAEIATAAAATPGARWAAPVDELLYSWVIAPAAKA